MVAIGFHSKNTMEVSGDQQMFGYTHSSKFILCSAEEKNWVNDDNFNFGVNYPFKWTIPLNASSCLNSIWRETFGRCGSVHVDSCFLLVLLTDPRRWCLWRWVDWFVVVECPFEPAGMDNNTCTQFRYMNVLPLETLLCGWQIMNRCGKGFLPHFKEGTLRTHHIIWSAGS